MSDVSTITKAIMAAAKTGKYAAEVNAIWGAGIKLLQDVDTNHKPEWEKKEH